MTKFREESLELIAKKKDSKLKLFFKLFGIFAIIAIGWAAFNILLMLPAGVGG